MTANPSFEDILIEAREWIGTPYVDQASVKGIGCDCLGLIRGVYSKFYSGIVKVPPYTPTWNEDRRSEELLSGLAFYLPQIESPHPGDIVVIRVYSNRPAKHCGIYTSPSTLIHAYYPHRVQEDTCLERWLTKDKYYFRYPGVE